MKFEIFNDMPADLIVRLLQIVNARVLYYMESVIIDESKRILNDAGATSDAKLAVREYRDRMRVRLANTIEHQDNRLSAAKDPA